MRPVKLTISAFGPYAGKEEIPFYKLGKNGVYVITGNTGAGKTTIFDAITFALYGDPSGTSREVRFFRSKYAREDEKTYVELVFECRGKEYVITRNPGGYLRAKTRGEGQTMESASQSLQCPDGRILTSRDEVNGEIEDIIGVTKNQFMQIAMIAQGDFLKLLLASTKERMDIFRKIFNTENFLNLQNRLKEDCQKLDREKNTLGQSVRQYIADIRCEDDDVFYVDVQEAKAGRKTPEEVMELLEALLQRDAERQKTYLEKKEKLTEGQKRLNEEIAVETEKNALRNRLAQAVTQLEQMKGKHQEAEERMAELQKQDPEIKTILDEASKLEVTFVQYNRLEEQQKRLIERETESGEMEQRLRKEEQAAAVLRERIDNGMLEREQLRDSGVVMEKLIYQMEEQRKDAEALSNLKLKMDAFAACVEEQKMAQERFQRYSQDNWEKQEIYNAMHKAYLEGQAGILANNLSEGMPCPVCGSTHHPVLATRNGEVPDKESLKRAKVEADEAAKLMSDASAAAFQAGNMVREKREAIEKLAQGILKTESLEGIEDAIRLETKRNAEAKGKLSDELCKATNNHKRYEELERQLPQMRQELEKITKEESELKTSLAANKADIANLRNAILEAQKELAFSKKAEAEAYCMQLRRRVRDHQNQMTEANQQWQERKEQLAKLGGTITSLQEQVGGTEPADLSERIQERDRMTREENQVDECLNILYAGIRQNQKIKEDIARQTEKLLGVENEIRLVKALSDTANGEILGKGKIKLETYIQMTFFDRIIAKANLRLMVMTEARYELKRRVEALDNKSQTGLDLNVIDHWNGSERPVSTLSGGESFVASLALALGMADVIQSAAGGVQLDSMFIDEGFGTLDEEILEQTMKALASLGKGNRLVGIISHREELKARIDRQIVVEKNPSGGSLTRIVVS